MLKNSEENKKNLGIVENRHKRFLLNSVYVVFILSLLYRLCIRLVRPRSYDSWEISEFLINYQGGFVRRGLTGEILSFVTNRFNLDVEWSIKIFCLTCLIFVCAFFIKSFSKKGYSLYILPLCFFLGSGILSDYWIRKDYMFFCFFIPIIWLYKKDLPMVVKLTFINALAAFMILNHEVFVFFTIPILLAMFFCKYRKCGFIKSIATSFFCVSPSIITFLATLVMHGNEETAQLIWNSWVPILDLDPSEIGDSIRAIGWSSKYGIMRHIYLNFLLFDNSIYSTFVWIITLPIIYYIATNVLLVFRKNETVFTNNHKTVLSSILIFQFICLSPMFLVLSCDYIRICFYWIASSFAVFLLMPINNLENMFPAKYVNAVEYINQFFADILRPTKTNLTFLLLCIGVTPWGFSVEGMYKTTMLYNALSVPSMLFEFPIQKLLLLAGFDIP